jgi:hypothetical protein
VARTPVTTEIEQPKREPVPVLTNETLINATHEALSDMLFTPESNAKPRDEINPIIDGYRDCARPDCGASFKPRSINPKEDDATEYYCSSDCAIHEFYRKRHLGAVPEKIVSGASSSSNRAHREEKKRKRAEAAPERDARYGPMRKVIEVLGETKTAKKVKLECGHIINSRGDQQRCPKCRVDKETKREESTGEAVSRDVSTLQARSLRLATQTSRRVRSEGLGSLSSQPGDNHRQKAKRTPVKPPKRGKKGKR